MSVSDTNRRSAAENEGPSAPANENADAELTSLLNDVRVEAIYAREWCEDQKLPLSETLRPIVGILSTHNLFVSDQLGESGFSHDAIKREVHFNKNVLLGIAKTIESSFSIDTTYTVEDIRAYQKLGIALYVYHEITHITQNFAEHDLARELQQAFSPDELSKIDLVADIRSAHCCALVACAYRGEFNPDIYMQQYRSNLLLSYTILVTSFQIKSKDHKKKRALGILTSCALIDSAIRGSDNERQKYLPLAIRPAFTSVSPETSRIVALTCGADGWVILFAAEVETEDLTVQKMWDGIGTDDPTPIIGLLSFALRHSEQIVASTEDGFLSGASSS